MANRPWAPRLIGATAQVAGVTYALWGHPRWNALLAGTALVLLGHGMINVRSMSLERLGRASRLLGVATTVLLLLGSITALLSPSSTEGRPKLLGAAAEALSRMFGRTTSWNIDAPLARAVNDALPVASALLMLAVLVVIVGPMSDLPEPTDDERRHVAALCGSIDSDLLAPFTRRHDKRYVHSPDGQAALGYRVAFGVCVAGAGPIGAPGSYADAMLAFLHRCDERGWRPAMIGASQATRNLARTMGMHAIQIGDEAIVHVAAFRLDRPSMRNVRQAVQRTRNSGVTVSVHIEGRLDATTRGALIAVVDEWRKGSSELGFAMTLDHLLDGTHGDAVIVVARHDGAVVGFQRYLICRGGTGLSLDVMPRIRSAPNGTNERLIVEAIGFAGERGITDVSLNFAAFRTLFESAPTVGHRSVRRVVHFLDPLINVESLYRFNAKFRPDWYSRYVLFRSPLDLPIFVAAALHLEFGRRTTESTVAPNPARAHA